MVAQAPEGDSSQIAIGVRLTDQGTCLGFDRLQRISARNETYRRLFEPGEMHAELGGCIGTAKHEARKTGGRGDGDEQAGTLPAHHRQHCTADIHWAEQQRLDLVADLAPVMSQTFLSVMVSIFLKNTSQDR